MPTGRPGGGIWLGVVLASTLVGVSFGGAYVVSPPNRSDAERVRHAVSRALRGEVVTARELSVKPWTKMFAFGPLMDRERIGTMVGRPVAPDMTPVGPRERLLVFVDHDSIVHATRIGHAPVELACLTTDRASGVAPGAQIRVAKIKSEDGHTMLAAAGSQAPNELAECLAALPNVP